MIGSSGISSLVSPLRVYLHILSFALLLSLSGCKTKTRYVTGDHLIPLGSSDPTQIVTVVSVKPDSYVVAAGGSPEPDSSLQTRARGDIDSYYVRVELPVGGSWARREDIATPAPSAKATPSAPPSPTATPTAEPANFVKLIETAQPALVLISVFDNTGRLSKTGAGFFISDDGRIATTFRNVEGALNGVAKAAGGKIYNVTGILAASAVDNLAVVKAEAKNVSFLSPTKATRDETGGHVAVVESALRTRVVGPLSEATMQSSPGSNSLQLTGTNLNSAAGAPVIDGRGDLIGIATADESGPTLKSVRPLSALTALIAGITANSTPRWSAAGSPTPSPASPKPTATPRPAAGRDARLLYAPTPRYPTAARFSYKRVEGTGRYVVQFGANGLVTDVHTVQTAGSDALDNAALDTLRTWRAQPGLPSQRTIAIPFKKPYP